MLLVAACLALGACNDDDALQLVDAAAKTDGGTDGGTLRGDASITGLDSSVGTNIDASILDATTPPSSTPQDAGSDAALNIVALSPNGHF